MTSSCTWSRVSFIEDGAVVSGTVVRWYGGVSFYPSELLLADYYRTTAPVTTAPTNRPPRSKDTSPPHASDTPGETREPVPIRSSLEVGR